MKASTCLRVTTVSFRRIRCWFDCIKVSTEVNHFFTVAVFELSVSLPFKTYASTSPFFRQALFSHRPDKNRSIYLDKAYQSFDRSQPLFYAYRSSQFPVPSGGYRTLQQNQPKSICFLARPDKKFPFYLKQTLKFPSPFAVGKFTQKPT